MPREDCYASPFGAAYSAYMERPRLSRALGRVIWGGDTKAYRLLLRPHRGDFGPLGTEADLLGWLSAAGLELTGKGRSGLYMFFEAQRRGADTLVA